MNQLISDRIAANLGTLQHPGNDQIGPTPIPLPMFRTSAITPEMREAFANEADMPHSDIAKLVSEAIVALIEEDHAIVPKADIAQLQAAAAAAEPHRNARIELRCRCGTTLFTAEVNDFDTLTPTIYAPAVIKHMQTISPECALGHKAT